MVDNFSKFVILGAFKDRKSNTLASWMMREIVGNFGVPIMVKSDNGLEFKEVFDELCNSLGVEHRRTLPYHP